MTRNVTLKQLIARGAVIPTISYARVSSERQLSGEGLARQRRGTLEWIAKHAGLHIRLDAELEDRARSAWKGDHISKDDAALGKILEMVMSGDLQPPLLLIMEALDRLSRENPWVAQERLAGLVNRGVLVATTRDDKIYHRESNMADLIISVVYMCAANSESENKSFRVHETKLALVQEAMITKNVLHQNCPAWMQVAEKISRTNRATRRYELIERHAVTVLTIYTMGLHHGSYFITRWLIENKVEPFGRTGRWSLRSVKKILRSRAPIGHLKSKHGIIENIYPRVPGLSDELWLQVQQVQDARRDAGSKPWVSEKINLLVGIGRCGMCGGRMRLTENDKTGRRYYGCHDRAWKGKTVCANTSRYRQDIIEAAMLHRFGLGWLEAQPVARKAPADLKALESHHDKLRARKLRLAGKLKTLDADDNLFDLVMTQLRELDAETTDAATKLQAARQAAAVAMAASAKIRDLTDRAAIASALRQQLVGVRFLADNLVELESQSHILSVIARTNAEKPMLALKFKRDAPKRIIPASRRPVEIKWLRTKWL